MACKQDLGLPALAPVRILMDERRTSNWVALRDVHTFAQMIVVLENKTLREQEATFPKSDSRDDTGSTCLLFPVLRSFCTCSSCLRGPITSTDLLLEHINGSLHTFLGTSKTGSAQGGVNTRRNCQTPADTQLNPDNGEHSDTTTHSGKVRHSARPSL
mmetsp:Transcript_17377/g.48232  ORF Transcript_17377/g.48232 Transcript_17377/m.48232 type:complete len:158 (-) Transcript_17377:287-760(-)|eukprot:1137837-Pelagomonas_calceolata.AAC.2